MSCSGEVVLSKQNACFAMKFIPWSRLPLSLSGHELQRRACSSVQENACFALTSILGFRGPPSLPGHELQWRACSSVEEECLFCIEIHSVIRLTAVPLGMSCSGEFVVLSKQNARFSMKSCPWSRLPPSLSEHELQRRTCGSVEAECLFCNKILSVEPPTAFPLWA